MLFLKCRNRGNDLDCDNGGGGGSRWMVIRFVSRVCVRVRL